MNHRRLEKSFFNRHAVTVAQDLLGKILVLGNKQGIITETEAYRGEDDEASHAFNGRTKRSDIMFAAPGHSYVYLIYGMYHCFNIVTEPEGEPSAVLIRGLLIQNTHFNGPGKLTNALGINLSHNKINLLESPDFYVCDNISPETFVTTPRIGISKAMHKPWRFVFNTRSTQ